MRKKIILKHTKDASYTPKKDFKFSITDKFSSYDAHNINKIAQTLNKNVKVEVEIHNQTAKRSLFQKMADTSFQEVQSQKAFTEIYNNTHQIKSMLADKDRYNDDAHKLQADLDALILDNQKRISFLKKSLKQENELLIEQLEPAFIEYRNDHPQIFSSDEISARADEIRKRRSEKQDPDGFNPNQKLVFNGLVLNPKLLSSLKKRSQVSLNKLNDPKVELLNSAELVLETSSEVHVLEPTEVLGDESTVSHEETDN
ncbi:oligoendopeptidase F [Mycoplasmoides fastidiosum]|uniref:Oligoendopeptidase F n=1 Tax=Mycoplasmoides fastidiosum TaxID=92758 RepID=A0ABU0LY61_9BACT|nr:hypothetical protein [Mycoplasmoides fastidiosum]MDQ0513646.1 oligoendopeptidase F [Mycoplasmoides fastidiosum]UUD37934.1 hypothetical protein NPA10_00865 [Mycoplasmoides fastidiosum]